MCKEMGLDDCVLCGDNEVLKALGRHDMIKKVHACINDGDTALLGEVNQAIDLYSINNSHISGEKSNMDAEIEEVSNMDEQERINNIANQLWPHQTEPTAGDRIDVSDGWYIIDIMGNWRYGVNQGCSGEGQPEKVAQNEAHEAEKNELHRKLVDNVELAKTKVWPLPPINKPPLGLIPAHIHDQARLKDISDAIARYVAVGEQIPTEWIDELIWLNDYLHMEAGTCQR